MTDNDLEMDSLERSPRYPPLPPADSLEQPRAAVSDDPQMGTAPKLLQDNDLEGLSRGMGGGGYAPLAGGGGGSGPTLAEEGNTPGTSADGTVEKAHTGIVMSVPSLNIIDVDEADPCLERHGGAVILRDPARDPYRIRLLPSREIYSKPSRHSQYRIPLSPLLTKSVTRGKRFGLALGAFLKELREDEDFRATLREIACDPKSKNFPAVLRLLVEYDEDKPVPVKEVHGRQEIVVRFEREGRRITAG